MGNKKPILQVLENTKRTAIHITHLPNKVTTCFDSKFGGSFYLPEGMQAPTYPKCGEMEFLAQLNFSQMPHMEDFPQKGLIQFFLCTDEAVMERMADKAAVRSSDGYFQVVYYPEANDEQFTHKEQCMTNRWPMEKLVGGMMFERADEIATLSLGESGFQTDLGYEDALRKLSPALLKKARYDLSDCPDTDQFCLDFGNWGCKAGGHPSIRQGDIRLSAKEYEAYSLLLFQFDLTPCVKGNLEADTFNFFIKPEDLRACKFDDILLYWHNCY